MTFRYANEADVPLLAVLNAQLIQDEGHRNSMTVPQLEERMRHWLRGEYEAVLFESESGIVAYALHREDEESFYLRQFLVRRECRRRGVGREAMRLLLAELLPRRPRLTLEVLAHNEGAHQFWRAVGFADYAVTMEFRRPTDSTATTMV